MKFLFIPILILTLQGCATSSDFIAKPDLFSFGSSIAEIQDLLEPLCSHSSIREIRPITAPLAKNSQVQIDCMGFEYAGAPRRVEVVFQDDQLDIVWILIPENEKEGLIERLIDLYGEPSMQIEEATVFLQSNTAVRNHPSEVLFASDRQIQAMLNILADQSSNNPESSDPSDPDS